MVTTVSGRRAGGGSHVVLSQCRGLWGLSGPPHTEDQVKHSCCSQPHHGWDSAHPTESCCPAHPKVENKKKSWPFCGPAWGQLRQQSPWCSATGVSKGPPSCLSKAFLKTAAAWVSHQESNYRLRSHPRPSRCTGWCRFGHFGVPKGQKCCSKSNTKHFWSRNVFTALWEHLWGLARWVDEGSSHDFRVCPDQIRRMLSFKY